MSAARCTADLLRAGRADLALAGGVMSWIGLVLWLDRSGPVAEQVVLGVLTWGLLLLALRRESPQVRTQTGIVVVLATVVEYTFSPLLEAYTYRLETVPAFVPPGHGLVYLAALALGRCALFVALRRPLVVGTVVVGGAWAVAGLLDAQRPDALGAFWFVCLLGFLRWGRSQLLYVGAFVVVSWLELLGTAWGNWAWAARDPVLGVVGQGNPPSGAAGGYGWFDLYALLLAPWVLRTWTRWRPQRVRGAVAVADDRPQGGGGAGRPSAARTASCRWPLLATAFPPKGPSAPDSEVNRPPASVTIGTNAAMSCSASSGSAATSTAPSATST